MKKRYLRIVRRMYRALRHPRLRHRDWWQALTHALFERRLWMPCRDTVATGLAIGLFFAVMPVPMQMIFAGVIAMRFRSNVPIAMASCWLSNPVTNVPIWAFQLLLGNWIQSILHLPMPEILGMQKHLPGVGMVHAGTFILGAIASGFLLALLAFPLVHLFALLMPQYLPVRPPKAEKVSAFMRKIRAQREARRAARKVG